MNNQEILKAMLQDVINGREEQAAVTMHEYFVSKMRQVTGLSEATLSEEEVDEILESASEEELDEALRAFRKDVDDKGNVIEKEPPKRGSGPDAWVHQERRDLLAKSIKKNRAGNRSETGYYGSTNFAKNQAKKPGESDEDLAKRKEEILKGRRGAASASNDAGGKFIGTRRD